MRDIKTQVSPEPFVMISKPLGCCCVRELSRIECTRQRKSNSENIVNQIVAAANVIGKDLEVSQKDDVLHTPKNVNQENVAKTESSF